MEAPPRSDRARVIADALSEVGVGFALIDASNERVLFANEGLSEVVGQAAREVAGLFFTELVEPADIDKARRGFQVAAVGAPISLRLRHADGRKPTADVVFRLFGRRGGSPIVVMLVAPTTARSEAEALRAALAQAMESLRQREDFFALAAHELRTPLTPLMLHLQTMVRNVDRDPALQRRSLMNAEAQVKRLAGLVEQLLDVARIRATRFVLDRRELDLCEVVRTAAARFAPECARSETPLETSCPGPVLGRWDPLRIDQIVTNLVSNAVKYGAGSPIFVSVRASDTHATLTVIDHGRGIPVEHQGRIFDRFERANEDSSVFGAGLGLWIARRLTEAQGGTIDVVSEAGRGATFIVKLPRIASTE